MGAFRTSILVLSLAALGGCTSLWYGGPAQLRSGSSSSLVDFLYPNGARPPEHDGSLPYLELPLRVGIAFVPGNVSHALPAREQQLLLDRVAEAFRDRPYVDSIEVIPESYLRTAKGVHGMQQVAALFDVDAMALVSYDQLALSGERDSAILYWTVVGALVVKGSRNEVQTLIDTAVFDVASARLLFRAPGTHRDSHNATLMDVNLEMRGLQETSFRSATDEMIVNLNHELEQFRTAVKEGRRAEVAWQPDHGGGAFGYGLLVLLLLGRGLQFGRRSNRFPQEGR